MIEIIKVYDVSNAVGVKNSSIALDYLANNKVDLITLDIDTPVLNGYLFLDLLSALAPTIPVVVITGYPDLTLKQNPQVKEFLLKPFSIIKFLEILNKNY